MNLTHDDTNCPQAMTLSSPPVTRRNFVRTTSMLAASAVASPVSATGLGGNHTVGVCIYGGTSGGVIAAVALAKLGRSVLGW